MVFSDCALLPDLSPYQRTECRQTTELAQLSEPYQLSVRHQYRKRLKTLLDDYDITLQYVTPDDADDDGDDDVPEGDRHALATGSALLGAATWLAHHVNADVEAVEERIRQAVGDDAELEVEPNRSQEEPEDGLFEC